MTVIKTHTHNAQAPIKTKSALKKNAVLAISACLAMSCFGTSFAEEDENKNPEYDFDQVVITATKTEKNIREVPAAVEVITKEDMEKRNVKRITDILESSLGVYVRQTKGVMGTTDLVAMRGFSDQKQMLIMINGQPLNDGYSGNINMSNIPLEIIDRIEIVRGPSSALYGSSAMGGVINIITVDKAKGKPETVAKFGVGGQKTISGSILTSGSVGKLDYFISGELASADGYETYEDYLGYPPGTDRSINPGKNGMEREVYSARFVYRPDEKGKIDLDVGKSRFEYFNENLPNGGSRDENRWNLGYQYKLSDDSSIKLSYGEKNLDSGYVSISYLSNNVNYYSRNQTDSNTGQAEIQYESKISPKDILVVGYALRTERADSLVQRLDKASKGTNFSMVTPTYDNKIGGKTKTNSLFFQDEHKINDKTTFYLGGRYDKWDFYDGYNYAWDGTPGKPDEGSYKTKNMQTSAESSFNPKIGIVYKANDKATVRSSIGTAFRAPNVYELARDWESTTGTIYISNPDLKPEKSTNYEIGLDYQVDETLLTRLTVYHSDVTDVINRYSSTENGRTVSRIINSSKARINGVEIGLNKQFDKAWNSFINYTYTDAKITATDVPTAAAQNAVGKQMADVPKNMFNIGVDYTKGAWQANLIGTYVSETNSPDKHGQRGYGTYEPHFILNTKVSYKISDSTLVSLSVDNLLNKKYYNYYVAQPRTAYLELMCKF